jgi:hypothetical protein
LRRYGKYGEYGKLPGVEGPLLPRGARVRSRYGCRCAGRPPADRPCGSASAEASPSGTVTVHSGAADRICGRFIMPNYV